MKCAIRDARGLERVTTFPGPIPSLSNSRSSVVLTQRTFQKKSLILISHYGYVFTTLMLYRSGYFSDFFLELCSSVNVTNLFQVRTLLLMLPP